MARKTIWCQRTIVWHSFGSFVRDYFADKSLFIDIGHCNWCECFDVASIGAKHYPMAKKHQRGVFHWHCGPQWQNYFSGRFRCAGQWHQTKRSKSPWINHATDGRHQLALPP